MICLMLAVYRYITACKSLGTSKHPPMITTHYRRYNDSDHATVVLDQTIVMLSHMQILLPLESRMTAY